MGNDSFIYLETFKNANIKQVCFDFFQYAKDYVARDIRIGKQDEIKDYVLINSINYIAQTNNYDFGFSTKNLYDSQNFVYTADPNLLLNIALNYYCYFINIEDNIIELEDGKDTAAILVDFMNYIARSNNIDKIFLEEELNKRRKFLKHKYNKNGEKKYIKQNGKYVKR